MNLTLTKAVIKARRNGLLRIVPANEPTRVDCLQDLCAKCCMNLGSPVVTEQEARNLDEDIVEKTAHSMFIKSKHSTCCLLDKSLCTVYQARPGGCREYPWYNIDGKLYYDSGCPGIKHDMDERPDVNDIRPFENFFPNTSRMVLWLIRKVCVRS